MLFEAYMQDGICIRSDNWNEVDPRKVKCLVVYHPFLVGFSVVLEAMGDSAEFFLWKEGLSRPGGTGDLVKVVFGKKEAEKTLKISFIVGGGIEAERG